MFINFANKMWSQSKKIPYIPSSEEKQRAKFCFLFLTKKKYLQQDALTIYNLMPKLVCLRSF